jgi:ABC-type polysaccharide/polyol phosphate transport system ATPase subunit
MSDLAVRLEYVRVEYPLDPGLAIAWPNWRASSRTKMALAGINLEVREGERVAIIGPNGAGKSTLLRVVAGILPPSSGKVTVHGRVAPLFEFATGFEMERTGFENIRIRALLQGLSTREIDARLDEIAEFSELGDALEQPVRTYSTGMFVRLAFSTATAVDPEILLIDEAFGAGDAHFSSKARERMLSLIDRGRILLFTSHNLDLAATLCTRCVWLDGGRMRANGPTAAVVAEYLHFVAALDQEAELMKLRNP